MDMKLFVSILLKSGFQLPNFGNQKLKFGFQQIIKGFNVILISFYCALMDVKLFGSLLLKSRFQLPIFCSQVLKIWFSTDHRRLQFCSDFLSLTLIRPGFLVSPQAGGGWNLPEDLFELLRPDFSHKSVKTWSQMKLGIFIHL